MKTGHHPPKLPPAQRPLIVTAWIHPEDLAPFQELRKRFFPAHRNYLEAHCTLFHTIPPARQKAFFREAESVLKTLALPRYSLPTDDLMRVQGASEYILVEQQEPISLGKGVAYRLEPEPLKQIRQPLRDAFEPDLTPQDARPWRRPHITVQNKVDPAEAKRLLDHLTDRYQTCTLRILGIECFRYDYGPWTLLKRIGIKET